MSESNSRMALNRIDGTWVGADAIHQSINPATYEVIGSYADGGLKAARAAIIAAKRAFENSTWAVDQELRARVIGQVAESSEGLVNSQD